MAPPKPFTLGRIDPEALAKAEAAARAEGISLEDWVARTIASTAERDAADNAAVPPPAGESAPRGEALRAGLHAVAAKAASALPPPARPPAASDEELAALKRALGRIAAGGVAAAVAEAARKPEPEAEAEPEAEPESEAVEAATAPAPRAPEHGLEIAADDRIGGDEPVIHRARADVPELRVEPEPPASTARGLPQDEVSAAASEDAPAPLGQAVAVSAEERASEMARRLRLGGTVPEETARVRDAMPEWLRVAAIALAVLVALGLVAWFAFGSRSPSEVTTAAPEAAPGAPAPAAKSAPAEPVPATQAGQPPAPAATTAAPVATTAAPAATTAAPAATTAAPAATTAAPVASTPAPAVPLPIPSTKPAEAKPATAAKTAGAAAHGPYTVKEIEKLARNGDPRAAYDLATLYARGDEIPRDFTQAARWFRQAATQGIAGAQYNLGVLYQQGLGIEQDMHEAISWYQRSAEQGYPPAEYNIGTAYADGKGVAEDDAAARQWFTKAAQQGLAIAALNLGVLCEDGRGGAKDAADAIAWYKIAMRGGAAAAEKYLNVLSAKADPATLAEGNRRYDAMVASIPLKPSLEPERRPPQSAAGAEPAPAAAHSRSAAAPAEAPARSEAAPAGAAAPELAEIQRLLNSFGYDAGPADGQPRAKTVSAIRSFQHEAGLPVDGRASTELLAYMKKLSGQP